jgi:pimeloyl-ACP methyl ester carboxylesterase
MGTAHKKGIQSVILGISAFLLPSAYLQATITYLFSHGLADTHKQAHQYLKSDKKPEKPYILDAPLVTFDYPDATDSFLRVNRTQTSLGQENEIQRLARAFSANPAKSEHTIVVGVSRGASTILNFMALYNPETVKAIILESPFDCAENVVKSLINNSRISWLPGAQKCAVGLIGFVFSKYKASGIHPIDHLHKIKTNIPILVVCSAKDKLVPPWSSINVYLGLKKSGNRTVHLLILPEGNHAKLITDPIIGKHYQNVAHAFYAHYKLPHNSLFAAEGKKFLAQTQPENTKLAGYFPSDKKGVDNFQNEND